MFQGGGGGRRETFPKGVARKREAWNGDGEWGLGGVKMRQLRVLLPVGKGGGGLHNACVMHDGGNNGSGDWGCELGRGGPGRPEMHATGNDVWVWCGCDAGV